MAPGTGGGRVRRAPGRRLGLQGRLNLLVALCVLPALALMLPATTMTPEVLARVTEPFFTTRPPGEGTGPGLVLARGFAERAASTAGATLTASAAP